MQKQSPRGMRKNGFRALQRGQGMTEYIIITAVIAIAAIAVFTYFGQTAQHQVAGMAHELSGQSGSDQMTQAGAKADQAVNEANQNKNLKDYSNSTAQ